MKNKPYIVKRYVIKCIQSNKGKFGIGSNHKKGQYITLSGGGVYNINAAHIYDVWDATFCSLNDLGDEWQKYYKYVPINIVPL